MLLVLLACQVSPILQPATYASDSGRVTLEVRPSTRDGLAGGDCTLREDGVIAWESRVEHAPWSAAVAEDGTVAAFSLSGHYWTGDTFHVQLLAPDGSVVLDEEHERVSGGYSHSAPVPSWARLFLQPELARFAVLLPQRGGSQSWWIRDLRSGAALGEHQLIPDTLSSSERTWLQEARSVPGTTLVLFHWTAIGGGASFQVADADREDAWRVVGRLERADLSRDDVSAILGTSAGRFDVRMGAEQVGFQVARTDVGWRFEEIARSRFEETAAEIPSLRLTLLGDEPLATSRAVRGPRPRWRAADAAVLCDSNDRLHSIAKRPDGLWFRDIEGVAEAAD